MLKIKHNTPYPLSIGLRPRVKGKLQRIQCILQRKSLSKVYVWISSLVFLIALQLAYFLLVLFFFSILILTELRKRFFVFLFSFERDKHRSQPNVKWCLSLLWQKPRYTKVLCSFHVFFSNKRLVDSQKTKIIAQFTENTHTHMERKWKNPPFFSRTIHKVSNRQRKNRL